MSKIGGGDFNASSTDGQSTKSKAFRRSLIGDCD